MTWTYDSGLPLPIRTLIRNAVVSLLQPLVKPTGFLDAVIPIGFGIAGPHDDLGIDLLWQSLMNRMPAIAVSCCECHDQPAGAPNTSRGKLVVELYFMTTHKRDTTEGRVAGDIASTLSDQRDPGLDAIMQLAWQLLFDAKLTLSNSVPASQQRAQPLDREAEMEILTSDKFALWKQRWTTMITLDANLYRGITQQLTDALTTLKPTGDEPDAKHMQVDSDLADE